MEDKHVVILDNGSRFIKTGIESFEEPKLVPAKIGKPKKWSDLETKGVEYILGDELAANQQLRLQLDISEPI